MSIEKDSPLKFWTKKKKLKILRCYPSQFTFWEIKKRFEGACFPVTYPKKLQNFNLLKKN